MARRYRDRSGRPREDVKGFARADRSARYAAPSFFVADAVEAELVAIQITRIGGIEGLAAILTAHVRRPFVRAAQIQHLCMEDAHFLACALAECDHRSITDGRWLAIERNGDAENGLVPVEPPSGQTRYFEESADAHAAEQGIMAR